MFKLKELYIDVSKPYILFKGHRIAYNKTGEITNESEIPVEILKEMRRYVEEIVVELPPVVEPEKIPEIVGEEKAPEVVAEEPKIEGVVEDKPKVEVTTPSEETNNEEEIPAVKKPRKKKTE